MFKSENNDDCGWIGWTMLFPLPIFIGIFVPACDGDGFRTIAPPGTSPCLSLKNIGSFTCNSADCCTITFGKLWDRFKCWAYWVTACAHTHEQTQIVNEYKIETNKNKCYDCDRTRHILCNMFVNLCYRLLFFGKWFNMSKLMMCCYWCCTCMWWQIYSRR